MLPLLAWPCALGLQRWPRLGVPLALYSVGITVLATLTDACPESNIENPLMDLHLPLLRAGHLSPNLGMLIGLPASLSVFLYVGLLLTGACLLWRRLPAERWGRQEPPTPGSAVEEVGRAVSHHRR